MFKDLTDDDINSIENYARTQLIGLLEAKANACNESLDQNLLSLFYSIYAVSPESFQFVPGDKKFIIKLRDRINDRIYTDDQYFAPQPLPKKRGRVILKGTSQSFFGLVYGDLQRNFRQQQNINLNYSEEDSKKKLFDAARTIFKCYEDEIAR